MASFNKLTIAFKALSQLGVQPVMLNALYRLGLATGHYRRIENREKRIESREQKIESSGLRPLFVLPRQEELLKVIGDQGKAALLSRSR